MTLIKLGSLDDVLEFARGLRNGSLPGPVVCLTNRTWEKVPAIAFDDLRAEADGLLTDTGVYFLPTGGLSREFQAAMPPRLGVFGGAARIWWPPVDADSDPGEHPLIFDRYDVYGSHTVTRICTELRKGKPTERAHVEDQEAVVLSRQLESITARALRAEREVRTLSESLDEERTRRLAAEKALQSVRKASAAAKNEEIIDPVESVDDWLRRGIVSEWLTAFQSSEDRRRFALGRYIVQPGFLGGVEGLQPEHRERVPWVCAMVVCGRGAEIAGLALHQLRAGQAGNDPQRHRASDGALAWRVALKVNSPSAPRIHFWAHTSGTIEFSTVGNHDEFVIS